MICYKRHREITCYLLEQSAQVSLHSAKESMAIQG